MRKQNKALRLGTFIAFAIILFVVAVYLIGSQGNLFSSTTELHSSFKDIRGLMPGNNVRLAGMNVGTVKNIRIESDTSVVVTMSVKRKYTEFIYKNSLVEIGQEGLMGGKIVLISSGTYEAGRVESGDILSVKTGMDIQGMIEQAQVMLEEATSTVSNLRSVTGKINSGDGDIARLINDNSLTSELNAATKRINTSLAHVNEVTDKINKGQGDLGKLVNDDKITNELNTIMTSLNSTAASADSAMYQLHRTTYALNHGEGALPRLLHDKQMGLDIDTAVANVDAGVVEVTRAANTIADSWIFNLFKKKKNKKEAPQPVEQYNVKTGDTIIIEDRGVQHIAK